jgi:hypothetical protein
MVEVPATAADDLDVRGASPKVNQDTTLVLAGIVSLLLFAWGVSEFLRSL